MRLVPGQFIHMVGIGGFGLSAIARVLLQQGFTVTGSDRSPNALTKQLRDEGALIFAGHSASNIGRAEMVIVSSAVPDDHVEVVAAREKGIPVYKRSDIIAALMDGQKAICVAGTHGKTTTTAMTTHVLIETHQRPSYIVGGVMRNTGYNAGIGTGNAFVIEADEYDHMFLGLKPNTAVITNVEYDHPDFFKTNKALVDAFAKFIGLLPRNGLLVACLDDPTAAIFAQNRHVTGYPVATYGISNPLATWRAVNLRQDVTGYTMFEVLHEGKERATVRLPLPGSHNVLNALAAIVVAGSEGVPVEDAAQALLKFKSTGRRFEVREDLEGVAVVDDYAHHPTAIRAALAAAKQRFPGRKVWAVWQPHTYTRTRALLEHYATAFEDADHVLVTEIYAAREDPLPGVTSVGVTKAIKHRDVRHVPLHDFAAAMLGADVEAPAVIVILSAGDAPKIGEMVLEKRRKKLAKRADADKPRSASEKTRISARQMMNEMMKDLDLHRGVTNRDDS